MAEKNYPDTDEGTDEFLKDALDEILGPVPPKGEYDTPGPFERLNYGELIKWHGNEALICIARTDEAEREELVGLLNKGTHCDALMRVVYELLRYPEDKPPFDAAHTAFEAVMGREWDDEMDGE